MQWLIDIIIEIIGDVSLPSGTIILWNGSLETIPSGFVLCDGNNGTPNLDARYVSGAGVTNAPGLVGGFSSHTHAFTTNGHTHTWGAGMGEVADGPDLGRLNTTDTDSGTTQETSHLPPTHVLAYIMKT